MTDIPQVVADNDRAFTAVQHLVDGVATDQWTAATPCPDWNVRELLNHVTAGNVIFARLATGERAPGRITPEERATEWLGANPADGFRASGKVMHDAFLTPGVLENRYQTPFMGEQPGTALVRMRTNELLIHGWDLARATGQENNLPGDLAENALAAWRTRLGDRPREGMPFGEPVTISDDAPAIDRLAAYLGRQP